MIYKRHENYKWYQVLDKRQQEEVRFNQLYALSFNHGTDGHNIRILVDKLANQLSYIEDTNSKHEEYIKLLESQLEGVNLSEAKDAIYSVPSFQERIISKGDEA